MHAACRRTALHWRRTNLPTPESRVQTPESRGQVEAAHNFWIYLALFGLLHSTSSTNFDQ